jgi:hypothetical protein
MSRHTPGPWHVREDYYVGRPGKLSLAEVKCGDVPAEDVEQHRANARLIAAAPDLLAACESFLSLFRESDMRPEDECHEIAGIMRRAVARAIGGQES